MISPSRQKVIQIDITNACHNRCSHCTRFVGHHKKPFFMDISTFKRAVDSLAFFPGMVGIMGGEPTIHPDFATMTKYLAKARPEKPIETKDHISPIKSFGVYANRHISRIQGRKKGLWSSLGLGYYKHFELIQDTYKYQCLNDHRHNGEHISLLITRKELGIPDDEWVKLRNNCWVQKEWSASITPKGAFFCEVAAALDMLYGGPGGWPIEHGWWKREPKEFGEQLKWCDICSACLPVPRMIAREGKDYVSPNHYERLAAIGSPKIKSGDVILVDPAEYKQGMYKTNKSCEPYLDPFSGSNCRISKDNDSTKPKSIHIITVCQNYDDYLEITLPRNLKAIADCSRGIVDITVVTSRTDLKTQAVCQANNVKCFISDRINENGAPFAKGKAINDCIEWIKPKDWILLIDADIILPNGFFSKIMDMTINPGVLYFTRRWGPELMKDIPLMVECFDSGMDMDHLFEHFACQRIAEKTKRIGNDVEAFPFGYFQLFNVQAKALRNRAKIYEERFKTAEMDDSNFGLVVFPSDKRAQLPVKDFDIIHLPHGQFKTNWAGRKTQRLSEVIKNV